MKIIKNKEDFDELMEDLNLNNNKFSVRYTSSKLLIVNENLNFCYYPNKMSSKKGLHFIKEVTKYIIDNNIFYFFDSKINYNKINVTIKKSVWYKKDIYEIDLKAAYWYLAFKNGFISEDLFKRGLRVPKKIRLISLGTLAKNTTIFNYNEGGLTDRYNERNEATEGIFFKLAWDVDVVMRKLINAIDKKDFYFYWVDAIFFKGKHNVDKIVKIIKEEGLNFKVVEIKKIIRKNQSFSVEDYDFKVRNFNFINRVTINPL